MKNFLSKFNVSLFYNNIKNVIYRFPISFAIILATSILFFVTVHAKLDKSTEDIIFRAIVSFMVTFFFSVAVSLNTENISYKKINSILFQIIPLTFWVLFFLWFKSEIDDNFENLIFLILSIFGIIGYLYIAPYFRDIFSNKVKHSVYYWYFYRISVIFLISAILWWVLCALWFIAISSVITLFDLWHTPSLEKIYPDWAILSIVFFAPVFALTQIPSKKEYLNDKFTANAFFSFLVKYIAIPFIYIYFIILYAYSIKVLSKFQDWPKWEVSWMVIGFSIFWYITYIFSYIFEETNKFIKYFRSYFPILVLPQLIMLFYAIFLRIGQYDFTVNRYFVVVFGIWLAVISIYFIFSKIKNLAFIPFLLALFTILVSIWPWSVYSYPQQRQLDRLENNLSEAKILQSGKIVPLTNFEDIKPELSKEIYGWIEYLCDFDNCKTIKEIFHDEYVKLEKEDIAEFNKQKEEDIKTATDSEYKKTVQEREYIQMSKWQIVSKITEYIKVKSYFDKSDFISPAINFSISNKAWLFPLSVSWYNKLVNITSWKLSYVWSSNIARYNIDAKSIEIIIEWNKTDTIDITQFITKLHNDYSSNKITELPLSNLTYETWKYKMYFENISIRNKDKNWKDSYYDTTSWYLLIK